MAKYFFILKSNIVANNHFSSYIYQIDFPGGSPYVPSEAGGRLNSFPSAGVRIYQPQSPTTSGVNNNVTINAIIELLPTGLNQRPTKFYSADTVSDLNTAAT